MVNFLSVSTSNFSQLFPKTKKYNKKKTFIKRFFSLNLLSINSISPADYAAIETAATAT